MQQDGGQRQVQALEQLPLSEQGVIDVDCAVEETTIEPGCCHINLDAAATFCLAPSSLCASVT